MFVVTNICCDKHTFVAPKDVFCRDKSFVMTKMILVATPANDRPQQPNFSLITLAYDDAPSN